MLFHAHVVYSVTSEQRTLWELCIVLSLEVVPILEVHHIMSLDHPQKCLNRVDNKIDCEV